MFYVLLLFESNSTDSYLYSNNLFSAILELNFGGKPSFSLSELSEII